MPHYIYAAMVAAVMPLLSCPFTFSASLLYALYPGSTFLSKSARTKLGGDHNQSFAF
jgi:hypothetical protein